jgi:hypothetical protein
MRLGLGLGLSSGARTAPPSGLSLSSSTVAENATVSTVVGALSPTDGITWSIVDSAGGRFGISGSNLIVAGSLNFEANTSHSVTARATNAGGFTDLIATITVTDVAEPPVGLALSGDHEVAEDEDLGFVVGALSGTDGSGGSLTWTMVDGDDRFAVGGSNVILEGALDFEAASSHSITVRATSSVSGLTADLPVTIDVLDVAEVPPDNPPPDDGDIEDDGSFIIVPYVTTVDGGIKINGKKTSLSAGKLIYDIGPVAAGEIYTFGVDPDFTLLTNLGRNAAVGFVFKQGNDFHFVGNQGDGSTGLNAVQVSGDNKWNQGTGWDEDDAGAVANGTQAGPNFIQIQIADDGATYTYRTGASSSGPWTAEYTDEVPVPHDDTSTAQFGIGAIFRSNDTGAFSIKVTHYVLSFNERQVAVMGGGYGVSWVTMSAIRQVTVASGAMVSIA